MAERQKISTRSLAKGPFRNAGMMNGRMSDAMPDPMITCTNVVAMIFANSPNDGRSGPW